MSKPLIHIGFHKTGSSLLQRQVFASREVGFFQPCNKAELIHRAFILRDPGQPCEPRALAELHQAHATAQSQDQVMVLSHERLSGYPASGGYDQFDIAHRLAEGFPDANVLIVIREQRSAMLSMYLQTISDGSALTLKEFLDPPEAHIRRQPLFRKSFYAYHTLIARYQALFGEDKVKVLPYEWLRTQPGHFAAELVEFSGAEPRPDIDVNQLVDSPLNPSLPVAFQMMRRQSNKLLRSQLSNSGPIMIPATSVQAAVKKIRPALLPLSVFDAPLKRRLRKLIAQHTNGVYADSNSEVEALTGLDLRSLGYPLPG